MNVENVRRSTQQKMPILRLDWNNRPVTIGFDLKRTLLDQGVVFLGPEFEEQFSVLLAADESKGQPQMRLWGCTDDPELVAVVRAWVSEIDQPAAA